MARRGRFAPTPSGQLHIGNAYTALLAWLQMRSADGLFVLRMEDIDKPRCKPELADLVMEDLRWLGIDWDEGPDVGGPVGPYTQSQREDLYQAVFEKLLRDGWIYPCFCSRADRMAIASAPHGLSSTNMFACRCRTLTSQQRVEKSAVKVPCYRFRMPDAPVHFVDAIAGPQLVPAGHSRDLILKRADGVFGYQLAVVVDDATMGITDVLRGWDLLDSTPLQQMLYKALGWEAPQFAHVPLLCDSDGRRLSKRSGSIAIASMRKAGVAPEQVIGLLAFISGLHDRLEPMKAVDLISVFTLDKVPRGVIKVSEDVLQFVFTGAERSPSKIKQ
ncbi:tRNA glutamyl-Q(34) synthetase GluQRS [Alicyclobacillus pomorum]|uniref:tRNA glutamyl-Q(34) synthetase GluQRS n=1 Tax=Alicyclobacillus pomorum TaxID=204470 RepID=UPI001FDFCFFB|nr:tRNA glutamyl-Q(34) synthetase GluQRS [Alicyclobacillus pomorum]